MNERNRDGWDDDLRMPKMTEEQSQNYYTGNREPVSQSYDINRGMNRTSAFPSSASLLSLSLLSDNGSLPLANGMNSNDNHMSKYYSVHEPMNMSYSHGYPVPYPPQNGLTYENNYFETTAKSSNSSSSHAASRSNGTSKSTKSQLGTPDMVSNSHDDYSDNSYSTDDENEKEKYKVTVT